MKKSLLSRVEALPIMMVYAVILIAFMFTAPETFLGFRIYQSFMSTVPPPMLLALGFTLIVATGEIDLSFPAVIAFSGFVFAALFKLTGQTVMPLIVALASGALIGFVNGVLIAVIGIPSIIATLGAQFLWHGLTVILSGGLAWNIRDIREEVIHQIFTGRIGGYVPAQMLWVLGIAVILWFILNRHKFGEHVLFIGDNAHVAQVMGVNVRRTKIALFTLMGFLGAIAAVLLTLEMSTFWTTQGQGFLLISIAAVFIGGTSIFGGEATIVGTVFGALIVGSIEAGVVASGLGGFWTRFIVGLVLIVTVTLHIIIGKGKNLSPSKAKRERVAEADAAARTPPQQGTDGPS